MKTKKIKPVSNEVLKSNNEKFIAEEESLLNSLKEVEFVRAKASLLKRQIAQDLKLINKLKAK